MTERNLSDFHRIYNDCFYCGRPTDLLNDEIICFGYLSYKRDNTIISYAKDWVDYVCVCYGCHTSKKGCELIDGFKPLSSQLLTFEEYKKFVYLSKLL